MGKDVFLIGEEIRADRERSASLSLMASYVNDNVKKNSGMRCVSLFFCNFALESAETNNIIDN